MAESDELYTVKNSFWLGNYGEAIGEAKALRLKSEELKAERDIYVYRAHIGMQDYSTVLASISDDGSESIALQSVRLLATYLGDSHSRNAVLLTIEDMSSDAAAASDATFQLICGTIYLHEGNFGAALKAVKSGKTLEQLALSAQIYLRMDRVDLAENAVRSMQQLDDEASVTQLTHGWVCLAVGGDRYKEAALVFRDLVDRNGPAVSSLNGLGSAYLAMKRLDDAERSFQQALSVNSSNADSLANLVSLCMQQGKVQEGLNKWLPQLREAAPDHHYLRALAALDEDFDKQMTTYA